MKRAVSILLLIFLTLHSMGQQARYSLDFSFAPSDFVDTIAIGWDDGRVVVPVRVEGKELRFLLDTGASQGVVYTDSPIEGLRQRGLIITHDAIGRTDTTRAVVLPPLAIGHLTVEGYCANVNRRLGGRSRIDGILGFDIFNKGLLAKIDVRNNRLILSSRKNFLDNERFAARVKYTMNFHVPYFEVEPFAGVTEQVRFDTGSRQLFMMNKDHLDKAEKSHPDILSQTSLRTFGSHSTGFGGAESDGEVVFMQLQGLQAGDLKLKNIEALTTRGASHIGAAVLSHAIVLIDGRRHTIAFQPYEAEQTMLSRRRTLHTVEVGNRLSDIYYITRAGEPTIGLVRPGSQHYRQGFRSGDVIKQIDRHVIRSMGDLLRFPFIKGRTYDYLLQDRDGQERHVVWTVTAR